MLDYKYIASYATENKTRNLEECFFQMKHFFGQFLHHILYYYESADDGKNDILQLCESMEGLKITTRTSSHLNKL